MLELDSRSVRDKASYLGFLPLRLYFLTASNKGSVHTLHSAHIALFCFVLFCFVFFSLKIYTTLVTRACIWLHSAAAARGSLIHAPVCRWLPESDAHLSVTTRACCCCVDCRAEVRVVTFFCIDSILAASAWRPAAGCPCSHHGHFAAVPVLCLDSSRQN